MTDRLNVNRLQDEAESDAKNHFLQKYPLGQPLTTLDGADVRTLFRAAYDWLAQHYKTVNRLNVFPVPDGDTGTNMLLTIKSALAAAKACKGQTAGSVMVAAAAGAHQGSRGNSGVIFGQFLQGLSQCLAHKALLSTQDLAEGLHRAFEVAYQSVPTPVEGTILTVAREIGVAAQTTEKNGDLRYFLGRLVEIADQSVCRTPDLLPALKKAGVVDSGGKGLFFVLEGMYRAVMGQTMQENLDEIADGIHNDELGQVVKKGQRELPPVQWGFDVQFLIEKPSQSVAVIKAAMAEIGESPLVEGDENLVKVHVHVFDPGIPLSYAVQLGFVTDIVVENMDDMAASTDSGVYAPVPLVDEIGVVAVAAGAGFAKIFRNLGAQGIVEGGQSANPSTLELADAIRRLPNRRVLLLPNNPNVLLAATQAAELVAQDINPRQVIVIPSKTAPQGIAALLSFNPTAVDCAALAAQMQKQMDIIDTGEVTQAVRSAEFDGITVEVGDFIGLHNGRLVTRSDGLNNVVSSLLIQMAADESEIITIFYGDFVSEEAAQNLAESVSTSYPEQTVELVYGGQPFYHYILSTE
ncbi:MAG: DAK2 domain-containing protein [Caldilineaceae bacterium]